VFESGWVSWLIDMNDIWKDLSQIVVNVVVESPFHLAQEIPVKNQLIDVHEQLSADPLE